MTLNVLETSFIYLWIYSRNPFKNKYIKQTYFVKVAIEDSMKGTQ
jgi:hypothetical protein